jgi:PKD repeat protein
VKSDDLVAEWGAIELNPHFLADETEVDTGEIITFSNETEGGTTPYLEAHWDFDADGEPEVDLYYPDDDVMRDVDHYYDAEGLYTVVLTMKDSTPTTRWENRIDYITVGTERFKLWNCPFGGVALIAPDPGNGRPSISLAVDPAEITASNGAELLMIIDFDESAGEWMYFIPSAPSLSDITALEPGELYYVVVSDACELTIPQQEP